MPPLPDGLIWDLDIGTTQVMLSVVSAPSGDYNANGVVDAADYVVWRKSLGEIGSDLAADGNSDGFVDDSDYEFWRGRIGNLAENGADFQLAGSVPEPATYVGLSVGFVFVLARWRNILHENRTYYP
jgi:hypothetical protein